MFREHTRLAQKSDVILLKKSLVLRRDIVNCSVVLLINLVVTMVSGEGPQSLQYVDKASGCLTPLYLLKLHCSTEGKSPDHYGAPALWCVKTSQVDLLVRPIPFGL